MTERLVKQLEEILINLGEDETLLKSFEESYKLEFGEKYIPKYIKYLKSVEQKYYGGLK